MVSPQTCRAEMLCLSATRLPRHSRQRHCVAWFPHEAVNMQLTIFDNNTSFVAQDVDGQLPRAVLHPHEFPEGPVGHPAAAHPAEVHARHAGAGKMMMRRWIIAPGLGRLAPRSSSPLTFGVETRPRSLSVSIYRVPSEGGRPQLGALPALAGC